MKPLCAGTCRDPAAGTEPGCCGASAAAAVPLEEAEGEAARGEAAGCTDLGAAAEVHVSLLVKDMQKRLFSCSFSTSSEPRI